jgi:3'(2'), 5'-bisphosphate nucleotidase
MPSYCFYATVTFGRTRVTDWRTHDDFTVLATALLPAAMAAGRAQLAHLQGKIAVVTKSDATPVTEADRQSEAVLVAALHRVAPDLPIVAEEAVAAGARPEPGRLFFLVDPLDGTREFINGNAEFTINIALVRDGRPVFGLIYAAALGEMFLTRSTRDARSAKVDPAGDAPALSDPAWRRIEARRLDPERLTVLVSKSHMNEATRQWLRGHRVAETKSAGSSLKFCRIAAGEADAYPRIGPTCEWDVAAGDAVLTAAGGTLETLDGRPMTYGRVGDNFRNPDYVAWGRRS